MKKSKFMIVALIWLLLACGLVLPSCVSTKQWGLQGNDTIALTLTKDTVVGDLFVTHINGVSTEATEAGFSKVWVNPFYIKLVGGNPIMLTVRFPWVSTNLLGKRTVSYKTTELRFTQVSSLKAGDVLMLKWMYQTQTFVFTDAVGNILQQIIPAFN